MMVIRVFLNARKFKGRAHNEIYVVSTCEGPPQKKFQIFISIYVRSVHTYVIGSFYKEKTTRKQVGMNTFCTSCRKMV